MNKLEVNNLKISFRTSNGKVQAVRDISFYLKQGETLAIVGESGSGKSVSVRAILGILANNAIVEGGEIFYDGKDLLKIDEDDFHKIRGDKIAMIFQDPLSSLNPVVRIGKQLTEAMILKNKVNRRNSKHDYESKTKDLLNCTNSSNAFAGNTEKAEYNKQMMDKLKKFEEAHIKLEDAYNIAHDAAMEAYDNIKELLIGIPKNAVKDLKKRIAYVNKYLKLSGNEFVVKDMEVINSIVEELKTLAAIKDVKKADPKAPVPQEIIDRDNGLISALEKVKAILEPVLAYEKPDFFALGYYTTFVKPGEIPQYSSIGSMNAECQKLLKENFMDEFVAIFKNGIEYSYYNSIESKKVAIESVKALLPQFEAAEKKADRKSIAKSMVSIVEGTIDRLEINKDSLTYTFKTSIYDAIERYFVAIKKNISEQERFEKQTIKRDKLLAKGKELDWVVVDPDIADLDELKEAMTLTVTKIIAHLEKQVQDASKIDSEEKTLALVEYIKSKASGMVYKVTKVMARNKAIKLMEEVGIAEARKRYTQYPHQFSGGMRQRIVIAIALSANPDILVCDEPTTALDVTIQSQILELINKLKVERDLSIIFITHDLGVVANMADRIAVMYAGKIVETGTSEEVFYDPRHPYTWALLASMPDLDTDEKLESIPGTPPNMIYPPKGDAFAERNKYALKIDFEEQPPMFKVSDTHYAATWLLHPDAPKVEPPKIVVDRIARSKQKGGQA